jgi:maltooligosyltrehalose synthase
MKIVNDFNLHSPATSPCAFTELLKNWPDGRLKLYLTQRVLNFRRVRREIFLNADYQPLEVTGKQEDFVCSFARHSGEKWAIIVVPRLITKITAPDRFPLGRKAWDSSAVILPARPRAVDEPVHGRSLAGFRIGRSYSDPAPRRVQNSAFCGFE